MSESWGLTDEVPTEADGVDGRRPMGRFITTESVVLAVNVSLHSLPARGSSTAAHSALSLPGGGFTTLMVVAAQGLSANLAAPLGTGPNSFAVRKRLAAEGIHNLTDVFVGDIGVAMVMIEDSGEITTVRTAGVESEPTLSGLEEIELQRGDVVHINGDDLNSDAAKVITQWGSSLPDYVTLVLAVSPSVSEVPVEVWIPLLERADIVTMNIREAAELTKTLSGGGPGEAIRDFVRPEAALVRRLGLMGCEVQVRASGPIVQVPSYRAHRADTAGVGDTHVALMCAGLLQGLDLIEACRRANAAAGLMVARESNVDIPTPEDIDVVLQRGFVD